jgi:hypothetical protein
MARGERSAGLSYLIKRIDLDGHIGDDSDTAAAAPQCFKHEVVCFYNVALAVDECRAEDLIHAETVVCHKGPITPVRCPSDPAHGRGRPHCCSEPVLTKLSGEMRGENAAADGSCFLIGGNADGLHVAHVDGNGAGGKATPEQVMAAAANSDWDPFSHRVRNNQCHIFGHLWADDRDRLSRGAEDIGLALRSIVSRGRRRIYDVRVLAEEGLKLIEWTTHFSQCSSRYKM